MTLRYSVCVLHYGDPELTLACLQSSLALDPAPEERVVVWNDGEQPVSPEIARLDRVRVVSTESNLGFAGGANLGVRSALDRGDVPAVWLLNNDTLLEVASPGPLLLALEDHPHVGMVGPRILEESTGKIWHDGGGIEWPSGRIRSGGYGEYPGAAEPPREVDFVCGCAPLVRREAFLATGGFDDRYFLYYEDADLCLRMRNLGWRLLHVSHASIRHHGSATTGEHSPLSRYYRLRNRFLFVSLHAPDRVAARRETRVLRRKAHRRAWGRILTGRVAEGRAMLAALVDSSAGRWGSRPGL